MSLIIVCLGIIVCASCLGWMISIRSTGGIILDSILTAVQVALLIVLLAN